MFFKFLLAMELVGKLLDWTMKMLLLAVVMTPVWVFAYLGYHLLFR